MRSALAIGITAMLALYGCTERTPEMQLVYDAAEAMGGADAVRETRSLVLEASAGKQYLLGQSPGEDAGSPFYELDEYRRELDLENRRSRVTVTRTSTWVTSRPRLRELHVEGLDGHVGYDVDAAGATIRVGAETAHWRVAEFYHHPLALLQLALSNTAGVTNRRQEAGEDVVDVTSSDGDIFTLHVHANTAQPTRITSAVHDPTLGDVALSTTFGDYEEAAEVDGVQASLMLPRRISVMVDDRPLWEVQVTSAGHQDLGDLAAPAAVRSAPEPAFEANVVIEELADGVWRLAGQSHHSVLVAFDDFLALIEAPAPEARTLAVIEQARQLQPDKPLRYVVNTHDHFDHAGGIRAAVSEGLTVITHERNRAFYEDLVARSHTQQPDALALAPQTLTLELVGHRETYELTDGQRVMQVAHLAEDLHSDRLVVAYLPSERLLIEADAFSPGSPAAPLAPNLLERINEWGWEVERIVPVHGDVVDLATLEEAAEEEAQR